MPANKRRTSGLYLVGVLFLFINLVLGACSDSTPTSVTEKQPTPAASPSAGNLTYQGAATDLQTGKTFTFGLAQEPIAFSKSTTGNPSEGIGLDPANLTDHSSLLICRQIYETLFEYKASSMQYQYASFLKSDGIDVSTDGLTYTIRIGAGLKFSDNTPLDAEAIKFNLIRWANSNSIFHKGDFSSYRYYFIDQQGYSGYPGILDLDNLDVPNLRTLVIKLKKPMPTFFQVLSMPQFSIVAPSSFDNLGNFARPVGSGAYKVDKAYDKSVRSEFRYMSLKKNTYYTTERDPSLLPKRGMDTIFLKVLPSNQDGLQAVKDGTVDATDKIKPEDVPENSNDPAYEIKTRNSLNIAFLAMNQSKPPFDNVNVRQAFASAINTSALVDRLYDGLGKPAAGLIPPASLGFQKDLKPNVYDPQKARMLLVQAGYPDGITTPIELWIMPVSRLYYPDAGKIADAIIDDLAKINVKAVRKDESWVNYNSKRKDGVYSLFMSGWMGENGDPDEFLYPFFGEERKDMGYANLDLQNILNQARTSSNQTDRYAIYHNANDILKRDMPVIPLANMNWPVAVRRDLEGYDTNPAGCDNWANLQYK